MAESTVLRGAGWVVQMSDTCKTGQDPQWKTELEVCCAMPQGTTVTGSELRATTEAVSGVEHGKATFVLVGQVLENPTNPFKRLRSPDTSQRDSRLQDEPFFFGVGASSR